jgi:uncharacterized coiled-coil protein SlyX
MTQEELQDQVEQDRDEIKRLRNEVIAELRQRITKQNEEIARLRADIRALALVDRYNNATINAPRQTLPPGPLNEYNNSIQRLNEHYAPEQAGS